MMRTAIFSIMLRSLLRDRGALAMSFILPALVFTIFAVIFSGASGGGLSVRVAVADLRADQNSQALLDTVFEDGGVRRIALDEIALLSLLYLISVLPPTSDWFLPLAVPITLCLTVATLLIVTLIRRGILRELHIVAAALIAVSILCIAVESAVDHYLSGTFTPQWSLLVAATCTPLAVVALMLQRRRAIVEGMKFWFRM